MNITPELITRFLKDQCTIAEVETISAYLKEHPEEWNAYLGEEEWNEFRPTERLHPAVSQKMLQHIRSVGAGERKQTPWRRYAVAASLLIAIGLATIFFVGQSKPGVQTPIARTKAPSTLPQLKTVKNNGQETRQLVLSDSSVVLLQQGSEISYYDPFENNKRRVFLKGDAQFQVAKNAARPFTVFSKEISTTALGTRFRVRSWEAENTILVNLYEGKVRVETLSGDSTKTKYLLPGDAFQYNRTSGLSSVTGKEPSKVTNGDQAKRNITQDRSNWYMFNNQNLAQVFDQLSAIYNVTIEYSGQELSKMNFIGKIDKTDSIDNILKDIALLNKLSITKTGTHYLIRKK